MRELTLTDGDAGRTSDDVLDTHAAVQSVTRHLESASLVEQPALLMRRAALTARSDLPATRRDLERALASLRDAPEAHSLRTHAGAHRLLSDCLQEQGEGQDALHHAELAVALARDSDDAASLAQSICALARRVTAHGDAARAIEILTEADGECRRTDPVSQTRIDILGALGHAHFQRGDIDAADRALLMRAEAHRRLGSLDDASADGHAALADAERRDAAWGVAAARLTLGRVALARRNAEEAIEHLLGAIATGDRAPDKQMLISAHEELHRAYEMAGDTAAALESLRTRNEVAETWRRRADDLALARLRVQGEVDLARARERAALARSERLVAEIVEHTPNVSIQGFDADGCILFWNRASETLFGWTAEEMLGETVERLFADPDELAGFAEGARQAALEGASFGPFEWRSRHKDGSKGVALSTYFPVVDADGTESFICMDVDLTDRRQMEDALRARERRYRTIVEDQTEFIVRYEPGGILTFVNESYCRYFGRQADDLVGTSFFELIPEEEREPVHEKLRRLTFDAPMRVEEHLVLAGDGTLRWNHWTDRAIFDDDCQLVEYQAVGRDVHDRHVAEERLRAALTEVQSLKNRLQAENIQLQAEIRRVAGAEQMVGHGAAFQPVLAGIERVAPTTATALISGETGTGKELVARAIHARSARADRALVKVDCTSVTAGLVESELFGHERGAFTGAHAQRIGRFELADGGTLFLDEIGELPLEMQSKLLRVLEEGAFERVGSSHTIHVDVRVITATNRDLAKEVAEGRFRPDLYYRLNVFPITVPSLRERRDAIPHLAEHFVNQFARRLGREFEGIAPAMVAWMDTYDWPGNVRELRNVIERAAIVSTGRLLEHPSLVSPAPRQSNTVHEPPARLDDAQRAHILETLERTRWTIEGEDGAAARLGVRPSTLRSRMQRLGIERPRLDGELNARRDPA